MGTEWSFANTKPFTPNIWIEISEENLKERHKAMDYYEFETREYLHPRSSKALRVLAQKRGIEIGVEIAEVFCLVRTKL